MAQGLSWDTGSFSPWGAHSLLSALPRASLSPCPGLAPYLAPLCVSCSLWRCLLQWVHLVPPSMPVVLGGSVSGAYGLFPQVF